MHYNEEIELNFVIATNRGNKDYLGEMKHAKKITNNYWRGKNPLVQGGGASKQNTGWEKGSGYRAGEDDCTVW